MTTQISLLSEEEVRTIASFDITESKDLHDPKFGSAGSADFACVTCGEHGDQCMGHHASFSLGVSLFHPLVYKHAEHIINNYCMTCGEQLPAITKSRMKKCPHCEAINQGDYVIYAKDLEIAVRPKKNDSIKASNLACMLPKGYVVSTLLVPPIYLRTPEEMEWSSDIQRLYEQLVKTSKKDMSAMYTKIVDGAIGLMSGKDGIFRKLMTGKRVNFSGRAVIVGDPWLKLDEVAIPKLIAEAIPVETKCDDENVSYLKELAREGRLWWENTDDLVFEKQVFVGMVYKRKLENGDLVMLNRQPSLSRCSMMCFKMVIRKDGNQTLAINPLSASPFNADFDGDEMNVFFLFDKKEMLDLCHISKCVTMKESDKTVVVPIQDVVTGCYLMSIKDEPVDRELWDQCMMISSFDVDCSTPRSTHGLLRVCMPDYDGRTLKKSDLINLVRRLSGEDALAMLYDLQLVIEKWLARRGLTVSLKSTVATQLIKRHGETSDAFRERCHDAVTKDLSGTDLMAMILSGAKGTVLHASHMAIALGQQYINGKEGVFCTRSYSRGLTPDEFFGHQMAAREGVVSTGVATASTGYLNRRACKIMADLKLQEDGTVADDIGISSFYVNS